MAHLYDEVKRRPPYIRESVLNHPDGQDRPVGEEPKAPTDPPAAAP
jgi:hypothetical protein